MKIEQNKLKIGSRVILTEDVNMLNCTYTKGHEFSIYRSSDRGWDLIDDNGNKIDETMFMSHKLEFIK